MFSNTSRYSTPATTTTSTSYPHLSDHTQRTGSLVEYITMQHQKNENKILHNQSMKKDSSTSSSSGQRRRSYSPMREAILKGQFLD
ncbi:unnamed protein product [Cunninghamella echinulata]